MPDSSKNAENGTAVEVPTNSTTKKCRFPEVPAVVHNIPAISDLNDTSGGQDDVELDIDRLAQQILNLGANYNIPRHRSYSGSEYEVNPRPGNGPPSDEMRPRSASRGSTSRCELELVMGTKSSSRGSLNRVDFDNLAVLPRSASFSTQEQDLDTFYEGMPVPGWIDKRPLSCRYVI